MLSMKSNAEKRENEGIHAQNMSKLINDLFYIDHNAPFGATSTGGVFGRVADAKSAIQKSKNIGPSKKWVDGFIQIPYFRRFRHSFFPIRTL